MFGGSCLQQRAHGSEVGVVGQEASLHASCRPVLEGRRQHTHLLGGRAAGGAREAPGRAGCKRTMMPSRKKPPVKKMRSTPSALAFKYATCAMLFSTSTSSPRVKSASLAMCDRVMVADAGELALGRAGSAP